MAEDPNRFRVLTLHRQAACQRARRACQAAQQGLLAAAEARDRLAHQIDAVAQPPAGEASIAREVRRHHHLARLRAALEQAQQTVQARLASLEAAQLNAAEAERAHEQAKALHTRAQARAEAALRRRRQTLAEDEANRPRAPWPT